MMEWTLGGREREDKLREEGALKSEKHGEALRKLGNAFTQIDK